VRQLLIGKKANGIKDINMGGKLTKEEEYVYYVICPQSFSGLTMSGLFYGWASLNASINRGTDCMSSFIS
jgi:hypothetical protein